CRSCYRVQTGPGISANHVAWRSQARRRGRCCWSWWSWASDRTFTGCAPMSLREGWRRCADSPRAPSPLVGFLRCLLLGRLRVPVTVAQVVHDDAPVLVERAPLLPPDDEVGHQDDLLVGNPTCVVGDVVLRARVEVFALELAALCPVFHHHPF